MKRVKLILLIFLLFISGCEKLYTTAVKYEVQCDPPGFEITYTGQNGDLIHEVIKGDSWSREVAVTKEVREIILWASSDSTYPALDSITGKIYVEDELKTQDKSELLGIIMLSVKL